MRAPRWWSRPVPSVAAPSWLRRTADVLAEGSISLTTRWAGGIARWVRDGRRPAPGEEPRAQHPAARWLRGAAVIGIVWIALRLGDRLLRAHPRLTVVLVAAWCWLAWRETRTGRPRTPVAPAAAAAQLPEPEAGELPADAFIRTISSLVPPEEFTRILHRLAGGRQGVHHETLLDHLITTYPGYPWKHPDPARPYAAVDALATAVGAPASKGVRVRGQGVRKGIWAKDFPALPTPSPEPATAGVAAVVSAGQHPATPAVATPGPTPATILATPSADGLTFVVEPDHAAPAHSVVRWLQETHK